MMWERCRELVESGGGEVRMTSPVTKVYRRDGGAYAVGYTDGDAAEQVDRGEPRHLVDAVLGARAAMDPPAPQRGARGGDDLHYRDFLTVALVVPEHAGFPDNWIYVHYPGVKVGRIQNFGSWSPYMVKDGRTCLGLEYFVFEGDELWEADDEALIDDGDRRARRFSASSTAPTWSAASSCGCPRPIRSTTRATSRPSRRSGHGSREEVPNVHAVGRNGMHKYNNQDHSMYTAMLTVENIVDGAHHDIWVVNVEEEYHEEKVRDAGAGTGRQAPVVPKRVTAGTTLR